MRSQAFRLALLLFEALWLNVVVPGHQRGIVSLPGTSCPGCAPRPPGAQVPCRATAARGIAGGKGAPTKAPAPAPSDPAARCAICFFAARLTLPPAVDFAPPPLAAVAFAPQPTPEAVVAAEPLRPYDGRAPPSCA